jgi:hypothetical protein
MGLTIKTRLHICCPIPPFVSSFTYNFTSLSLFSAFFTQFLFHTPSYLSFYFYFLSPLFLPCLPSFSTCPDTLSCLHVSSFIPPAFLSFHSTNSVLSHYLSMFEAWSDVKVLFCPVVFDRRKSILLF